MQQTPEQLIQKYHVAAPRYTSYPTVPYWDADSFTVSNWQQSVHQSFAESNAINGISLYIHLPYCESLCTYCGCNTRITKNHAVEQPYIKTVLKEWAMYRQLFTGKPVIREIHLGGGTPTFFAASNLKMLIDGLLADAIVHPDAEFSFEAHPANTSLSHLQILHDLGFRRLSLGIQDFNTDVQRVINRFQTIEQVQLVTSQARHIGYTSINYDLIYGLPLQTCAGLARTIIEVANLEPDRIAFYSYAHVPWVKPGQRSFTENDLPDAATKQKLYETGRTLLTNHGYREVGMDHFALPADSLFKAEQNGSLHRNFMGYTNQYTQLMIGLGVSSISDTWYGFAQNVKKVEEYTALVNNNELPVFKGHALTADDLFIRRHILNLMCKGTTCWQPGTTDAPDVFWEGLERMNELVNDGLVKMLPGSITVAPLGKRFLRNICMALDARLWADKPSSQLFSMAG